MSPNKVVKGYLFHHLTQPLITYISHFLPLIQGESLHSPIHVETSSEASSLPEGTTDTFLTAKCSLFNSACSQTEDCPNHLISFHLYDSQVPSDQAASDDGLAQSRTGSQWLLNHQSPQHVQGYGHGGCKEICGVVRTGNNIKYSPKKKILPSFKNKTKKGGF